MADDIDSRLIDYSDEYAGEEEPEKPKDKARFRPVWDKEGQREMVCDRETGEIMCLAVVCAMLQFETELREAAEIREAEWLRILRAQNKPVRRITRPYLDLRQRRRRAA